MLLAWFQSELVPVVLHNSKITQVILSPSTMELVNWTAASLRWDDWVLEREGILHYAANQAAVRKGPAGCWSGASH